ncbi:LysR substrate-binding domain-containing protein [Massilia sp. CCM 9210]|uniref:LysR family transcriptional regulator n=1 Tax=Massilia scottii TaxID=3057166 RepID=UPI0027966A25|nr:LysR family transcriptional regulator [Massilia sp. CCM 9210]MDQ1812452.1 LysR substrate-binding domain-containing protein [Massilia sp. CCM 9210]
MARRYGHLGDVEIFLAVAEHGSLTAAAVALATTASVVSRALGRLEQHLGSQLLRRTTRSLSMTDAGQLYLEQSLAAFALIDDAERAILGQADDVAGRVRLSVPTTYAHYRLPRLLDAFSRQYPQVRVELNIANRNVDLVAEGFDLAVRLGDLPDSGMVARKLEDASLCLVASPDYLKRAGTPASFEELRQHACICFVMPSTGRVSPWLLRDASGDVDWSPAPRVTVSDDVLGVVSLAAHGLGVCQSYDFIVRERIGRGELVELLPQLRGRTRAFSAIYAGHRRPSAAARALIGALSAAR